VTVYYHSIVTVYYHSIVTVYYHFYRHSIESKGQLQSDNIQSLWIIYSHIYYKLYGISATFTMYNHFKTWYEVALVCRIDKIIGLFYKRAL